MLNSFLNPPNHTELKGVDGMPDHIYTIYLITCSPNSKCYTGFTSRTIDYRWAIHKCNSEEEKSNYYLHNAIRKYESENFIIEEIYQSWDGDHCLNVMEEYFIRKFKSHMSEGGYNMTWGGTGCIGYKHTEEAKEKIRQANIGRKDPKERTQKRSEKLKGKPSWNKGKKHPPEMKTRGKNKNPSKQIGKKHTEEHIRNCSLAKRRNYLITFPAGHQEQIKGLGEFSKQYNLSLSGLKRSSRCGSYYKGYLVKKL